MKTTSNRILVMGGSGFIGTNLVRHFIKRGVEVINFDRRPPGDTRHSANWRMGEVADFLGVMNAVKEFRPDCIFHLAARTDLRGTRVEDYEANISGAKNIIESVNRVGGVKRVVIASSMLVSGPGTTPMGLDDCAPTTAYGASKLEMERLIRSAEIKTEWLIVRPTSIWGPFFGEPYRNFFDLVMKGLFVHPGDKACTKTYGFVGNTVLQLEALLNAPAHLVQGKCFYLGDSPPLNISVWADEIRLAYVGRTNRRLPYQLMVLLAATGDCLRTVGMQFPMTSFRLKNMTTNNVFDLAHLMAVVGPPQYSTAQGIRMTLDWLATKK